MISKFWVYSFWDAYIKNVGFATLMCWLLSNFIKQPFSSFPQACLSVHFEDFIKKVSICPACFGFQCNSKISNYQDFFALFPFPFPIPSPFPSISLSHSFYFFFVPFFFFLFYSSFCSLCCVGRKKNTLNSPTDWRRPCLGLLIFNSTVLWVCLHH